ncbi:MAG: PAS domain-containing protein [Planctomycetota bacterium]|nr:PAS domain-containing protein [Planctomycetota bacterium]
MALKSPHADSMYFSMRGHAYSTLGKRYLLLRFKPQVIDTRSSDNLLKSTWLARLVFENAPDGVSVRVVSPDFRSRKLLACNQRYTEMAGYSEAQLMAMDSIADVVRSLLTPEQDAEIERKTRALEPVRGVARWVRPDGRDNAFEWHAVPMRVGDEIYVLGIDRDITEQRRAVERLRASQAEMDALINNIPDLVWFKDTQSRYITVNAAFLKATGKTMDELRGKTDNDISPPDIAAKYQADDARVVREKAVLTVEEKHELIGRPLAWIVTTKSPILDKDGIVLGSVGIARDITDRRHAEQENLRQRERLEQILAQVPSEFLSAYREDSVIGVTVTKAIAKRESQRKQ